MKKRYPVTLSENLLEWLQPYRTEKGSLLALDRTGKPNAVATRKLVLEAAKKAGVTLPDNGTSHLHLHACGALRQPCQGGEGSQQLSRGHRRTIQALGQQSRPRRSVRFR